MRWAFGTILLVVLVAGVATATASTSRFSDVPGDHVFAAQIDWLADEGITKGCNPPANDQYCPDAVVTRGQMAAFLVRANELTAVDPEVAFVDVEDSVFAGSILKLASAGITRGCNPPVNDRFCPDQVVTREQMAAFVVRSLALSNIDPAIEFADIDDSIFATDILRLATARVTIGCNPPDNDRFCPTNPVTRGQMAAFLNRAVTSVPTIETSQLPVGAIDEWYQESMVASGGQPPYGWTIEGLPDGLHLVAGQIVGVPKEAGGFAVEVVVTDSNGRSGEATLAINVVELLRIVPYFLPEATTGEFYYTVIEGTGGEPPYAFTGEAPPGLILETDGTLSGIRLYEVRTSFELTLTDARGRTHGRVLDLWTREPLAVATTSLPMAVVGSPYGASLAATGGLSPYTWTADGVPPGLEVGADGSISGTPTSEGSYDVAVEAVDPAGRIANAVLTVNVDDPLSIVTTSVDDAALYNEYSATLSVYGGVPPHTWAATSLPAGLSVSTAGVISGTPSVAGVDDFSVTVTDSRGRAVSADFDIFVSGIVMASRSQSGVPGDGDCISASISGDGRYVSVDCAAENFVAGDSNGQIDVYRHDRVTGEMVWVTEDPTNTRDNLVRFSELDYDGDTVAFQSPATGLVPGDTDMWDVYVVNITSGTIVRASEDASGDGGYLASWLSGISDDGRYVVFTSGSSDLVPGDTNGMGDTFLYDALTDTLSIVGVTPTGAQFSRGAGPADISGNGRYVVFTAGEPEMDSGAADGKYSVFQRDLVTGDVWRVNNTYRPATMTFSSSSGRLSTDGSFVTYQSASDNIVPDSVWGMGAVYWYENATGTTKMVSRAPDGSVLNNSAYSPFISGNGRFVTYTTQASNASPQGSNSREAYVWDGDAEEVARLSLTPGGLMPDGETRSLGISDDGAWVVLLSEASNLVPGDSNGVADVFVAAVDTR